MHALARLAPKLQPEALASADSWPGYAPAMLAAIECRSSSAQVIDDDLMDKNFAFAADRGGW